MAELREILEQSPPTRILVVRSDRVGDLILSTPFLQALRLGFPRATLVARVPPYCSEVLQGTGLVDLIETDFGRSGGDFDLAIALAPRTGTLKEVYRSQAALRLGYTYVGRPLVSLLSRVLLTHRETVAVNPPHNVPHEVEQLDRLARRLGLPPSTRYPLRLAISRNREKREGLLLHLGDRWLANGWEVHDLKELISGLQCSSHLVVTAGPREVDILQKAGLHLGKVDLRTDLSFSDWVAAIAGARLLVSPDTGAVHVAAAVGTPVVVAYEESTFEHCSRQWAPWKVPYRAVVKSTPKETVPRLLRMVEELDFHSRNCRI